MPERADADRSLDADGGLDVPDQPRARALLHRRGPRGPAAGRGGAGGDHRAGGAADRDRPGGGGVSDGVQGGAAEPLPGPLRAAAAPSDRAPPRRQGADRAGGGVARMIVATWNVNSVRA